MNRRHKYLVAVVAVMIPNTTAEAIIGLLARNCGPSKGENGRIMDAQIEADASIKSRAVGEPIKRLVKANMHVVAASAATGPHFAALVS